MEPKGWLHDPGRPGLRTDETANEWRLQRRQKLLVSHALLIIDELGFALLSKTGARVLYEIISQRYERGSIVITSKLSFDDGTEVFGSKRLTSAILDSLTHNVHILENERRKLQATPKPQSQNLTSANIRTTKTRLRPTHLGTRQLT
ncbi:ATP-binding protein [Roseobacter sp. EG26]|uniref:ATP-binding protein n=1 Tax=Roseobacter sp. EG26 TaxID=3412477 RepID=UPI003CE580FA